MVRKAPVINEVPPPLDGQRTWKDLGLAQTLPVIRPAPARLPKAATPDAQMKQFYEATRVPGFVERSITRPDGVGDVIYSEVVTPDGLDNVFLSDGFVRHVILDHPQASREEFANYVLPTLQNPSEVWRQWSRTTSGRIIYDQIYLARFKVRNSIMVAREMPKTGTLAWTLIPTDSRRVNKYRVGALLYQAHKGSEDKALLMASP